MKKILLLLATSLLLVGCGGGSDSTPPAVSEKIFILDQNGFSVSGLEYSCNGVDFFTTQNDGSLIFFPGERCELTLNRPIVDSVIDDLFIVDEFFSPVVGLDFNCANGDIGLTDQNGHFYFDNVYSPDVCSLFF